MPSHKDAGEDFSPVTAALTDDPAAKTANAMLDGAAGAADPFSTMPGGAELWEQGVYWGVLISPFIQEDAAVIGAAAAAVAGLGQPLGLFAVLMLGMAGSDIWKYWAGRFAHFHPWTREMAARPAVTKARDKVINRLWLAMLVARFVPGTRIPLYVAAGVFRAPFPLFAFYVITTAMLYGLLAFGLFFALGEAVGRQAQVWAPVVVISLVVSLFTAAFVRHQWRKRRSKSAPTGAASENISD